MTATAPEIGDRYVATSLGLELRKGKRVERSLSIAEWSEIGRRLGESANGLMWCIGDWMLMGARNYGSTYTEAEAITGFAYQTLANAAWVCSKLSFRKEKLSFGHHAAVAALSADEQERWLERALAEGLTREQLQDRLRAPRSLETVSVATLRFTVAPERAQQWQEAAADLGLEFEEWAGRVLDEASMVP